MTKHFKDLSHWNGVKPKGPQFTPTEYGQRSRKNNIAQYLCTVAKQRAKKKNIPFSIVKEDIILPEFCPILGIKLELNMSGIGGGLDNSFSLDRIVPSLGYIPGNIRVISRLANNMKSTANEEQLKSFAAWIQKEYAS